MIFPTDKSTEKKLPKNNTREIAQHRRELLEKVARRSNDEKPSPKTANISPADIKKLKKQLNSYKSNITTLQVQNTKINKKYRLERQTVHDAKKEHKELLNKLADARNEIAKLKQEKQDAVDRFAKEQKRQEKLGNWISQHHVRDIDDIKDVVRQLDQQIGAFAMLLQVQIHNNEWLYANWKGQQKANVTFQKQVAQQQNEIDQLRVDRSYFDKKISQHRKKNEELQAEFDRQIKLQDTTPDNWIDLLTRTCSTKNFNYYDNLDDLVEKYQDVLDQLLHQDQTDYRYGYLKVEDEHWYLHDINQGDDILVNISLDLVGDPNLASGATVRCRKEGKTWIAEKIYSLPVKVAKAKIAHEKKEKRNSHINNDRKIMLTDPDELAWAKQQKVLIVGNKYSSGFLDELKKYCQVKTMDAYEDGLPKIFEAMNQADYVFILIGSVPHAVTDYTKQAEGLGVGEKKAQIFGTPAKYDGVIRLHYLYANK